MGLSELQSTIGRDLSGLVNLFGVVDGAVNLAVGIKTGDNAKIAGGANKAIADLVKTITKTKKDKRDDDFFIKFNDIPVANNELGDTEISFNIDHGNKYSQAEMTLWTFKFPLKSVPLGYWTPY